MKTVSQVRHKVYSSSTLIGELRAASGLTVREVAKHSGVSHPTVNRVERGHEPSIGNAIKLARFFERSVNDLFGHFAK